MAKPRPCRSCKTQFRPGLVGSRKLCTKCRRGLLITPAEHGQGAWTTLTFGPWTDMTTAVRPGMYGRPRLPAAKIEERGLAMAQRLNPTLAEAEAARRAYARRPAGTPTVFQRAVATTLAGDGLPGPETGGSWADVALAEPIDD